MSAARIKGKAGRNISAEVGVMLTMQTASGQDNEQTFIPAWKWNDLNNDVRAQSNRLKEVKN